MSAGYDECQARVMYGALVNPTIRRQVRAQLGPGGGRWFSNPLFESIWNDLIEPDRTDNAYWDETLVEWLSRTQGDELTPEQTKTILELFAQNTTSWNAGVYADSLIAQGRTRLAQELGERLLNPETSIDEVSSALGQLRASGADLPRSLADILPEAVAEMQLQTNKVSTGYPSLDFLLDGGIGPGHLFVVGARTGRGKTAICINLAINAARAGKRVIFYALEMSDVEILNRAIRVDAGVFPRGANYELAGARTAELPIKIAKATRCTVADVEAAIEAEKSLGTPPDLVIVDYLQLLSPRTRTSSRQEQVADVSRDLKRLARVSGIAVVTPSQLRRQNDDEDGEPQLHHLRESGSIEQDADAVLLMSGRDVVERECIIVKGDLAKNRHGRTGVVFFDFHLPTQRFSEMNEPEARML